MQPQPVIEKPAVSAAPKTYFRMRDGKNEVGIPYWTLYGLYERGELQAVSFTPEGALYVARVDLDALFKKKLQEKEKAEQAA